MVSCTMVLMTLVLACVPTSVMAYYDTQLRRTHKKSAVAYVLGAVAISIRLLGNAKRTHFPSYK